MKRKVASRKLKRTCTHCNCNFKKGDVYYKKRIVVFEFEVFSTEFLVCPKCKYKRECSKQRFYNFLGKCHHPITRETYSYIPGEVIMQPEGKECAICWRPV